MQTWLDRRCNGWRVENCRTRITMSHMRCVDVHRQGYTEGPERPKRHSVRLQISQLNCGFTAASTAGSCSVFATLQLHCSITNKKLQRTCNIAGFRVTAAASLQHFKLEVAKSMHYCRVWVLSLQVHCCITTRKLQRTCNILRPQRTRLSIGYLGTLNLKHKHP